MCLAVVRVSCAAVADKCKLVWICGLCSCVEVPDGWTREPAFPSQVQEGVTEVYRNTINGHTQEECVPHALLVYT